MMKTLIGKMLITPIVLLLCFILWVTTYFSRLHIWLFPNKTSSNTKKLIKTIPDEILKFLIDWFTKL